MPKVTRMPRTEIFSIFGQIEAVVAEAMVDEGKLTRIPPHEIPPSAATNEAGTQALFAVVVPRWHLQEFERRIADLRA